jgi:hypothetical protein
MTPKIKVAALTLATFAVATAVGVSGLQAADAVDNQNPVHQEGKPNSAPGVQGFPDTRTGPATRAPGDGSASEGASTGASGQGQTTQPSQDSSGVEGLPGNKSGPAVKQPSNPD